VCGIYGLAGGNAADRTQLERRRDLLRHRGPDDAGSWLSPDGRVALAHRRLSIIDLSPAGHQPMVSGDRRLVITFNGEIYNHRSLRHELEHNGSAFSSQSDTEVILAAYAHWGTHCVEKLNGMFAFALYDAGGEGTPPSLFLARDRAGEKPLYYWSQQGRFEFASELKALAAPASIDPQAVNHYLGLGYVPGELSLLAGVRKLPPGHAARLNLVDFSLDIWRYWQLPAHAPDPKADAETLADQAGALLGDSVRMRLQSDVPLGILLSGGLDSSLVVAAAARSSDVPVKTFTIALPGSPLDESAHAAIVAQHFSTEHHRLELDASSLSVIDELAPLVDEPLADSSLLPAFVVSRLTRRHVTVALGGDGGDELFGGYRDYPQALADQARWGGLPADVFRLAAGLAARLPAGVRGRNRIASLRGGPLQQIIWGSPYFDVALRRRILDNDVTAQLGTALDAPEQGLLTLFNQGKGPVDRMTRTHFGSILPDDFLVKVDRASMAHSLEMRCPFLDHRLIEFCFSSVPDVWKVSGRQTRPLQKLLAGRMLPATLDLNRKQGFSIPLDQWLRAEPQGRLMERFEALPDYLNRHEIHGLIRGLHAGRANGARLFALLMLSIACRNQLAGRA
jgi:asparagine synthase (glutamine-hydrolysing)